jgi:hypothetical protein
MFALGPPLDDTGEMPAVIRLKNALSVAAATARLNSSENKLPFTVRKSLSVNAGACPAVHVFGPANARAAERPLDE